MVEADWTGQQYRIIVCTLLVGGKCQIEFQLIETDNRQQQDKRTDYTEIQDQGCDRAMSYGPACSSR